MKDAEQELTEAQLAQIKTVFPVRLHFRREKNLPNHKVTPNNKNKWQLTVEVNTNYEADMKVGALSGGAAAGSSAQLREYRKLAGAAAGAGPHLPRCWTCCCNTTRSSCSGSTRPSPSSAARITRAGTPEFALPRRCRT